MIGGGVLLVLLAVLLCCCCCCCRRRRARKHTHVEYNQLENPVYTVNQPVATPKTNEWRAKMSEKYGIGATSKSAQDEVWN
jgi:hypothetical protein